MAAPGDPGQQAERGQENEGSTPRGSRHGITIPVSPATRRPRHWPLHGSLGDAALEALARGAVAVVVVREAGRVAVDVRLGERAGDDAARQAAADRAGSAASRLLHQTKRCSRLIGVDLTAARPVLTPGGTVELPGDTGALLFEIKTGGDGLQYSASWGDFALPPGRTFTEVEATSVSGDIALGAFTAETFRTATPTGASRPGTGPLSQATTPSQHFTWASRSGTPVREGTASVPSRRSAQRTPAGAARPGCLRAVRCCQPGVARAVPPGKRRKDWYRGLPCFGKNR